MTVFASQSISLDGYSAGPDIDHEHGMGRGGDRLHEWMFNDLPSTVDTDVVRERRERTGAVVIGRTMYDVGVRHWGDTPFPVPTVVVTHEALADRPMTSASFTFVTDGVEAAVARAREAAGDRDVCILGGASVIRQCVDAGLVDELDLQLVPVLLGAGTRLFDGYDRERVELRRTWSAESPYVTHLRYRVVRS